MPEELINFRKILIELQDELLSDARMTRIIHSEEEYKELKEKIDKDILLAQGVQLSIKALEKEIIRVRELNRLKGEQLWNSNVKKSLER